MGSSEGGAPTQEGGLVSYPGGPPAKLTALSQPFKVAHEVGACPKHGVERASQGARWASRGIAEAGTAPVQKAASSPTDGGAVGGLRMSRVRAGPGRRSAKGIVGTRTAAGRAAVAPVDVGKDVADLGVDSRAAWSTADPMDNREGAEGA